MSRSKDRGEVHKAIIADGVSVTRKIFTEYEFCRDVRVKRIASGVQLTMGDGGSRETLTPNEARHLASVLLTASEQPAPAPETANSAAE